MATHDMEAAGGRHVVITLHGIMTYGSWQDRLAQLLMSSGNIEVINYNYGFYWFARFLFPPSRYFIRRRFQEWLLDQNLHLDSVERVDFVAHSFGTHVLGITLTKLATANAGLLEKLNTIVLAGSVLRSDFNWDRLLRDYPGLRIVNECGWKDGALIASQLGCIGTGMAGKVGFHGGVSQRFRNHFHSFGHGGFFQDEAGKQSDEFMSARWLPLLTRTQADYPTPVGPDERPAISRTRNLWLAFLNAATVPKLAIYAFAIASIPLSIWMIQWKAESERKDLQRRNEVAQLKAESRQKELEHQAKVADLKTKAAERERELASANLRAAHILTIRQEMVDAAKLSPLLENATVHQRVRQFLVRPVVGTASPDLDSERRILESLALVDPDLKFPADFNLEVESLRNLATSSEEHALIRGLAEHWLMTNPTSTAPTPLARDQAYKQRLLNTDLAFETALKWSETASPSDRIFVNFAYGAVLHERGDDAQAVMYLERALKQVSEQDDQDPDSATHWFHIHVLASLADAYVQRDWEKASAHLREALKLAEGDGPFILGQLHLARGWIWMSRFSLADARNEFDAACAALEKAQIKDFHAKDEYFWARHGRAMVRHHQAEDPKQTRREVTFKEYTSIIKDVDYVLGKEIRLTIKDRLDLHERRLNSGERKGDAMMLMRNKLDLAETAVIKRAQQAYEDVAQYYRENEILAKPDHDALIAQILCKAAVAAAVLKDKQSAVDHLAEARKFTSALAQASNLRVRFDFYQTLANVGLEVCAAEANRDALESTVSEKELQLREVLTKARETRPERDDLEFLYFLAQLVDQKRQSLGLVADASRESLVRDVREFMTK